MRICTVIVTHNRPQLLARCVAAVRRQTFAPAGIIVVDNASDVVVQDVACSDGLPLAIDRFSHNTGGAGGFHYGLAEAFRHDFDAAWLMDDDGVPANDCLEKLQQNAKEANLGFANALVVDEGDRDRLAFGLISYRTFRGSMSSVSEAVRAADQLGTIRDAANPFNGTLITRCAYQVLGDIKYECFIWGDEEEYLRRALAVGIDVGTSVGAIQYHPSARSTSVAFGPRKTQIRLCPSDRSQYFYRNLGYSTARYRSAAAVAYLAGSYVLYFLKERRLKEMKKFVTYYLDGATDRYKLKPSRDELKCRLMNVSRGGTMSDVGRASVADTLEGQ